MGGAVTDLMPGILRWLVISCPGGGVYFPSYKCMAAHSLWVARTRAGWVTSRGLTLRDFQASSGCCNFAQWDWEEHLIILTKSTKKFWTPVGSADAGTLFALKVFRDPPRSDLPGCPMLLHQYMNGSLDVMHPTSLQKDTTFTKIFVGGLPYHTNDASLRKYFEAFGDIDEAVVITDRQTGKSRGYGFVSIPPRARAFYYDMPTLLLICPMLCFVSVKHFFCAWQL